MSVTCQTPLSFAYTVNSEPLMSVDQFRYLGVLIASDLSWNAHVNFIVQKSMQKLWFLRRNICHCTPETKPTAYRTILRPMFEYSDVVWDP